MTRIKRMVAVMLVALIAAQCVFIENADAKGYSLDQYRCELNKINEELGTDYFIPENNLLQLDGKTEDDVIKDLYRMNLDEFREYVTDIYRKELGRKRAIALKSFTKSLGPILRTGGKYTITQAYFFDPEQTNRIELHSEVYSVDGATRYYLLKNERIINAAGVYPRFVKESGSHSYSNGNKRMDCKYKGQLYYSKSIAKNVTFRFHFFAKDNNAADYYN